MKTIRFMGELCLALAMLSVSHEAFAARYCSLDGKIILSGSSITAFLSRSVPYGSSCQSQVRYCSRGDLSGSDSYRYSSCKVAAPLACSFNGKSVAHGASVSAFALASVPAGSSCVSEQRTCNNGVLSGSFSAAACSVQPVTVVNTVNPPSLYRCTNRQEYGLPQLPFYDAYFALAPDNDYDCLNANNFFALQVGGYYSTIPGTKAIWDYQNVLKIYDGSPVTINPSMCATRLASSQDVIKAPSRMSMTECHSHCINVSVANYGQPVVCFFAHTPVETAVSGFGDDRWTRPPPPPSYDYPSIPDGYVGGGG